MKVFSNCLSTSDKRKSSLSFIAFLIFVNIFCIFNFKVSLFSFIFSSNIFKLLIEYSKVFDSSSNLLILSFNLFFFSSFISFIKQISQSWCWPFPFFLILAIQDAQHNILWFLQKYSNFSKWFSSLQNPVKINDISLSNLYRWWFWNISEW